MIGYVSAHTHTPFHRRSECLPGGSEAMTEWNVGSIVDWPMETNVLVLGSHGAPRWQRYALHDSSEAEPLVWCPPPAAYTASYTLPWSTSRSEACSHAPVAERLLRRSRGCATIALSAPWHSDASTSCTLEESHRASRRLAVALDALGELASRDNDVRDALICLAARASHAHGIQE